jgi:MFS transporter, FSR family, fosmidomycin resistance protein
LLGVEFLNEWFSNLLAAVLPAVRVAFGLNYFQVSLLFTLLEGADVVSDGVFGIVGDVWSRRLLIAGGTIAAGLGLILMGTAPGYLLLLLGVTLHGFAGGPFVGLSQASLMDAHPRRHEQMLAWWDIVGTIGFLLTPLMVTLAYLFGSGWRPLFLIGGGLFILYACFLTGLRFPRPEPVEHEEGDKAEMSVSSNWAALKVAALNPALLRWALILPLLDVPLKGFVVLYFHDVASLSDAGASLTLYIFIGSALVGKLLVPWLLRSVSSNSLLRWSVWIGIASLAAFLGVPNVIAKYALLAVFSLVESSWHPLAMGQAYSTQPGKSGVVLSVTSLISPITSFVPLLVGGIATQMGLTWGLAMLLIGPVVAGILLLAS